MVGERVRMGTIIILFIVLRLVLGNKSKAADRFGENRGLRIVQKRDQETRVYRTLESAPNTNRSRSYLCLLLDRQKCEGCAFLKGVHENFSLSGFPSFKIKNKTPTWKWVEN